MIPSDSNYLNLLHTYAEILDKIMNEEHMNSVCGIMLQCFEKCDLTQISPLVLRNLALTISGKISICVNAKMALGKHVLDLIKFLIKNGLVDKVFHRFLSEQIERIKEEALTENLKLEEIKEDSVKPDGKPEVNSNLRETLYRMLNISEKAEKYTKKHFGYSLLDLQGNFVWADENSCALLDMEKGEFAADQEINFFDLMIPMSKKYLHSKFGEEFFGDSKEIGSSRAFTYVIYSKSAMQNCLRTFKKKRIEDPNTTFLNPPNNKHLEIFTRYLKSLSSRASLIMLSFSEAELQSLLKSDKCDMQISTHFFNSLISTLQTSSKKTKPQIFKLFVFLETRLATVIPNFDYSFMKDEPQILLLSQTLKSSLSQYIKKKYKNENKQEKESNVFKIESPTELQEFSFQKNANKLESQVGRQQKKKRLAKKKLKEKKTTSRKKKESNIDFVLDVPFLERRKLERKLKEMEN